MFGLFGLGRAHSSTSEPADERLERTFLAEILGHRRGYWTESLQPRREPDVLSGVKAHAANKHRRSVGRELTEPIHRTPQAVGDVDEPVDEIPQQLVVRGYELGTVQAYPTHHRVPTDRDRRTGPGGG